ncbi:hypothetical protein [Microbulbifer aggregans]|uniref:hypothetical protein n=1 Tax=Microbulbifer aggregans TaxID=1769779 RepID=UPI001CFD2F46|nr:hypothetical protein [Microbulbifer aggregans]
MSTSESSSKRDYSLVAPVGVFTTAIHVILGRLFKLVLRYPWPAFALVGLLYLVGIVVINIPMLDIDRGTSALVLLSPLLIVAWGGVAYLFTALVLLSLFARCPDTRLTWSAVLVLLVLGPWLILVLGNTRWLLPFDQRYLLVVVQMVGTLLLFIRARHWFKCHARWSTPALLLLVGVICFEWWGYFFTTEIPRERFTLHNCKLIKAPPGKSGITPPVRVCDVVLQMDGSEYTFRSMPVPDTAVKGMQVRHALFDHYHVR